MIGSMRGIFGGGSLGAAQRVAEFAEARNTVLVDNIANIDTPGYRTRDLSVDEFQKMLGAAMDGCRRSGGPLRFRGTRNISVGPNGSLSFQPIERSDNDQLYHDGGNRSVEQEMSELAKNTLLHRVATEVMRKQFNLLQVAIRERL